MNKLATVLGVAAVATLAGCKDASYRYAKNDVQDEAKAVPVEEVAAAPAVAAPVETAAPKAAPAPVVVEKAKPVAQEYTIYIVQNGDFLAKISKKFNVKISAVKQLNNMKSDIVRVGQKLKLPGKIDVGVQKEPVKAKVSAKVAKKGYEPYTGATKEYVVKANDTLGKIAYDNGCNIRQLKELNGLSKDSLKIGQKLKVPADGKAAKATVVVAAEAKKEVAPVANAAAPEAPAAEPVAEKSAEAAVDPALKPIESAPKADEAKLPTHVVQEGDDVMGIAIRWGVSPAAILELNNLSEGAALTPGQVIKLPAEAEQ